VIDNFNRDTQKVQKLPPFWRDNRTI